MKYENLTHSQKSIYDKLEKQIKDEIKELENKIIAFSKIDYFPKKNGKQKENFSLNFGLKDVGVSYKDKRWGKVENVHPVNVTLDYGYRPLYKNGLYVPSSVQISVKARYCHEKNEYLDNFSYCTDTIYFSCSDVKEFLGFDVNENPEKITAETILKLIRVFWIENLTKRLQNHKEELEKLPFFFENAIKISNFLVKEVNNTYKFSFIHNFYYGNFERKDVFLLCNLKEK